MRGPIDPAATRVQKFLRRSEITRGDVAQELAVSPSLFNMYFTGRGRVRKVVALALQATYGVSAHWIMTGEPPMVHERLPGSADVATIALHCERLAPAQLRIIRELVLALAVSNESLRKADARRFLERQRAGEYE